MKQSKEITIFISYAREDILAAKRLYQDLTQAGAAPWLDEYSLLPGQRWESAIRDAIRTSRYFIVLLSTKSLNKRGFINKEITEALSTLDEFPQSEIFLIPIRLDDCLPSHPKLGELHRVDMFPLWENGLKKILKSLHLPYPAKVRMNLSILEIEVCPACRHTEFQLSEVRRSGAVGLVLRCNDCEWSLVGPEPSDLEKSELDALIARHGGLSYIWF